MKSMGARNSLKDRVEQTALYMESHLDEKLTRETLARMAGLNPEHYSRLFKKYKGQSPVDYLTELRMQAAKRLLLRPGVTVRQAAKAVGFEDPYYFSRRFRLYMGAAPSEFKQQRQPRVVAVEYYGHLRALGLRPVGVSAGIDGLKGLHADWSEDAVDIGKEEFPYFDLAAIHQLNPDVICAPATWIQRGQSEAIVVEVDDNKNPFYPLRVIGAALGMEKQAEDWLRMYEEKSRLLRDRLEARMKGQTIAILRVRAELLQIYGNEIMGYGLYKSLGLTPPDKLSNQFKISEHYHSTVISLDELPFYHADHLIVVVQPTEETLQLWEQIRNTSVWTQFPAVRKGNIYKVDVHRWLAYDPLSIMAQMEEAANLLGASDE